MPYPGLGGGTGLAGMDPNAQKAFMSRLLPALAGADAQPTGGGGLRVQPAPMLAPPSTDKNGAGKMDPAVMQALATPATPPPNTTAMNSAAFNPYIAGGPAAAGMAAGTPVAPPPGTTMTPGMLDQGQSQIASLGSSGGAPGMTMGGAYSGQDPSKGMQLWNRIAAYLG